MCEKILRKLYNSTHANCCKCGCELETCGDPLGQYFVLDRDGKFYCMDCDIIFDEVDDRIYEPEEE